MAEFSIRLSPSGPVIGKGGAGFRLRMHQAGGSMSQSVTTAALPILDADTGLAFVVGLDNPRPDLNYAFNGRFMTYWISASSGSLVVNVEARYKVAGTFGAWASLWDNGMAQDDNENLQTMHTIDIPMRLGSALKSAMPAACERVECRLTVQASAVLRVNLPEAGDGSCLLSLEELAP